MREREGEDRGEEETLKGPTERRGGGQERRCWRNRMLTELGRGRTGGRVDEIRRRAEPTDLRAAPLKSSEISFPFPIHLKIEGKRRK